MPRLFRPFLKFTGRNDLVDPAGLAGVRRSHAILPVLPDEVERLVVHACATPAIAARDAAITLLAVTTGLRACDIINLRLADIDSRSARRRTQPGRSQDPADGAFTDPVPESGEFALDSPVTPARVFPRQP